MSKITCRKLSNEEVLKKYWRSSFVFVEGTGVILEHVPESNETHDQEKVGSRQDANVHSGKNVQGGKNLLPVCCPLRVHSDASPCICSARHNPPLILREFLQLRRFAGNRWRRRSDSNRRITVLQTVALGHLATPPSQSVPGGNPVLPCCQ